MTVTVYQGSDQAAKSSASKWGCDVINERFVEK